MRTVSWCLILTVLGVVALARQPQPDFSGTWVLQEPRQPPVEIPRMMAVRQPLVRTTVLGEPMAPAFLELTVERHFDGGVRAEAYRIGTEGGTVPIAGDGSDPPVHHAWTRESVRWEGDRLRIESGRYSGPNRDSGPYTEHLEVWWLDDQSRLRITVVDRWSGSEVQTRALMYRRQIGP
jgi:hypothetical protein